MLPSWAGKVPTDQKSVVNWVPMDWGMCSLSAGGARNTLPHRQAQLQALGLL